MNQRSYVTHRRGVLGPTLAALGIVCLGLIGGALLLHWTGAITLPFLVANEGEQKSRLDTTGKTPVPISVRPIQAYDRVSRQHILNPSNLQIAVVWMRPADVPEDAAKGAGEVLGRVMRWDKEAGQIFLMSEFYPKGTRPGPTAGVPPGKRAMRLRASEVPGLHGLKQGDRFDIVMTIEVEVEEPRNTGGSDSELDVDGPYAPLHDAEANEAPRVIRRRAEVRVVVSDGIVVQPIRQRQEIGEQGSLLRGSSLTKKPIEEVVIAVDPEEVSALHQARAIEARLQVAMRTGQVSETGVIADEGTIPDIAIEIQEEGGGTGSERKRVCLVEVIEGGEKRLQAVPLSDEGNEEKDREEKKKKGDDEKKDDEKKDGDEKKDDDDKDGDSE